jgi:SAM-dependent methyltransferase
METAHDASTALAERLLGAAIGALDLLHVHVGDRLGLYQALAAAGPLSARDLARRCDIDERYAREWLEQQAVARLVDVADGDTAGSRRYELPAGHAAVLVDGDSLTFLAPVGSLVGAVARSLPAVLDAFRTGQGVPYEAFGPDLRQGIARLNRPMFLNQLARAWFPAVPGLVQRLGADPPAEVVDVGCGSGWSSIAIALGFPTVRVTGIDLDAASIDEARTNAATSGVADRVAFEVRDAAHPDLTGRYDLVCAFETIHDMCDPIGALRAMRAMQADGGTVLVADERVADEFTTDVDDVERFQWGFSALHCLPTALTEPPAAGTGTIMRTPTFEAYARDAGFDRVEVLPIDNDFWRFYRLLG